MRGSDAGKKYVLIDFSNFSFDKDLFVLEVDLVNSGRNWKKWKTAC